MKGKLNKINGKWFVEYSTVSYTGGNPKILGSYSKKIEPKRLELTPNNQRYLNCFLQVDKDTRVKFKEVLINPMGREVDSNNLGQNHSGCVWYAELAEDKEDLGYTTKMGVEVSNEMVRATMIPKEYFGKEEQKQHLIDMMESDEELGLYDIFNDEKREGVKRVIHQHKVLKSLSLVNPAHLQMTSNGHGEFPDGYKLTEKGIQYIIEQLNKE
jgi:hypothetical protein